MKSLIGATALVVATSSTVLAAPTSTKYNAKGDTAYASAYANSDCGYSYLDINASEDVTKSGGTSTSTKALWVNFYSYDTCKGTETYGSAQLPLTVDVNTNAVVLDFTLDVQTFAPKVDANGVYSYNPQGTAKLTGKVTVTGTGTLEKGSSHSTSSYGPYRSTYRYSGSYREASVTIGAQLGSSPLSFSGSSGTLGTYKTGSAEIIKSR